MDIDLELHCCKFYNEDIKVLHTYFLVIPEEKTPLPSKYNWTHMQKSPKKP